MVGEIIGIRTLGDVIDSPIQPVDVHVGRTASYRQVPHLGEAISHEGVLNELASGMQRRTDRLPRIVVVTAEDQTIKTGDAFFSKKREV